MIWYFIIYLMKKNILRNRVMNFFNEFFIIDIIKIMTLSLDLGAMIGSSMSYQNLFGEQWSESENKFNNDRNQSFLTSIRLKKPISKITSARWYYQQRNVPNPFNFEYTESTISGYRIGIKLGNGMILNYIFRRSFRDIDGDGKVNGENETINMTSIETSFSF